MKTYRLLLIGFLFSANVMAQTTNMPQATLDKVSVESKVQQMQNLVQARIEEIQLLEETKKRMLEVGQVVRPLPDSVRQEADAAKTAVCSDQQYLQALNAFSISVSNREKALNAEIEVYNGFLTADIFGDFRQLQPNVLDRINKMTPIFDGKTMNGWDASVKGANQPDKATVWTVKDGALASLGVGRGVLYTDKSYAHYRIIFTMRHISGNKDHQACVLIYCDPPKRFAPWPPALDALGGIQFQVPNGGHWDYRPGHNNGGKGEFETFPHPKFDVHQWSEVEILVNTNGTARMAVAQPPGTKAYEVLDFDVPDAGKPGVFALQMHNKGLYDEYKDIRIEENPTEDTLITTQ